MDSKLKVGDFVTVVNGQFVLDDDIKDMSPGIGRIIRLDKDHTYIKARFPAIHKTLLCLETELEKVGLTEAEKMLWVLENE